MIFLIDKYNFGDIFIYLNTENGRLFYSNNNEKPNFDCNFYEDISFDIMNESYSYSTINILINITEQCNLSCKYCFNKNKSNKTVKYEDIIRFIDKIVSDFPNAKKYQVDLSGSGEPLLELKTILKVSDYCRNKSNEIRKEVLPMFVSNGTLMNKEIASVLQNHGILFGISIDGLKRNHDKNRVFRNGKPTFKYIINNVKNIDNKDYVGCAFTIDGKDIDLVKSVKYLSKYFNTISMKIVRSDNKLDFESINYQYTRLTDFLIQEIYNNKIRILLCLLNGDDLFGKYISLVLENGIVNHRCDAGIGKFALSSDLKVYCCSAGIYEDSLCLGDIDNIDYVKGRMLIANAISNPICLKCKIRRFCGHECLVRSVSGIDDEMCKIKKHLFELALVLSLIIKNNYSLYIYLLDFLQNKRKRFEGDDDFDRVVKYYDNIQFVELKRIKDFEEEKYSMLLKNIK